jgi:DNA-directed RNA polymerase specialized sigma24 family protein
MKDQPSTRSLAWAWVLEHAGMIRRISHTHTRGSGLDPDDHHGDLILRIVEKFQTYDPKRASASTWLWWQSMAVRKNMVGRRSREITREIPLEEHHHPPARAQGESVVLVNQIRQEAQKDEWDALLAVVSGYTGHDLGEVCGCAPFSARRRVSRLRSRVA